VDTTCTIETATNCYPGRLVKKGTADKDLVVATAGCNPAGWLGYEQAAPTEKPASMASAYAANSLPPLLSGGGFVILATLSTSQTIAKDDALVADDDGCVKKATALGIVSGATSVTSAAANGTTTISGSVGSERIVGYADESVTTTSATKTIAVRSLI
jgi:hypothetical protein